jgi:hypothetical protein
MSSKTRTRKTRTTTSTATNTTGSARTLRSVPDPATTAKVRTDTEDKLWAALHANPNSTAADLSTAAKIGKSTAGKILVKWAGDGSVTRTAGIADGGRRAADLWAITNADDTPATADQGHAERGDAESADTAQADPDSPVAPDDTDAATSAEGESTDSVNSEPIDAAADDTQDTADTEASDPAQAEPVADEATESADGGAATAADPTTDGGGGDDKGDDTAARLAPGALRGMVEDHLRDHPGEQFGPTAIANALGGKSSGAVSNALDKLVADGTAVKTLDKPRRFALAPAGAAAAPAPTN